MTINGLAAVLFVHEETKAFTSAGLVAGALTLGMGAGAPLAGRLVDKHGAKLLPALAIVHAAALVCVLLTVRMGAPMLAVMVAAAVTGTAVPPCAPLLRATLPRYLADRPALLTPAYALDSLLMELTYMLGPLVVASLILVASAGDALLISAFLVVVGTWTFVILFRPLASSQPRQRVSDPLGPLRSRGLQTLMMTMVPVGVGVGSFEVMLPAFSSSQGAGGLAGVLLALMALGSVFGAFLYGVRPWPISLQALHLWLTILLPVAFLIVLAARSMTLMAFLVIPAGLLLAPIIATRNELASAHAPVGTGTEALTWPMMSFFAGISVGAGVGGRLIDVTDWRAAATCAVVFTSLGALLLVTRRASLETGDPY